MFKGGIPGLERQSRSKVCQERVKPMPSNFQDKYEKYPGGVLAVLDAAGEYFPQDVLLTRASRAPTAANHRPEPEPGPAAPASDPARLNSNFLRSEN